MMISEILHKILVENYDKSRRIVCLGLLQKAMNSLTDAYRYIEEACQYGEELNNIKDIEDVKRLLGDEHGVSSGFNNDDKSLINFLQKLIDELNSNENHGDI